MSQSISSIPASQIVDVVPSVISGGGAGLLMIGLQLDSGTRTPIGAVLSFPDLAEVGAYHGATSVVYEEAAVYFSGFDGEDQTPAAMLVAQYPTADVAAWLRGGAFTGNLTALQAIGGGLTVDVNGTVTSTASFNLSGAVSLTSGAQIVNTNLGTAGLVGATAAVVTAEIGSTFTGNASGVTLTVTGIAGLLSVGDTITGTGISGTVTIATFVSGTPGGNGVYTTSASTTASSAAVTGHSTVLNVTGVTSGVVAVGQLVAGSGVTTGTYVTALGTGTGGDGTYTVTTAQEVASESITLEVPVCTYDSISGSFVVTSPTTGAASTIGFGSGAIATGLNLTQAEGAVTSQGAAAAVPATFMDGVIAITEDWATFWTNFDPDAGSGNTVKQAFAAWNNSQNDAFLYAAWDTDITPTESTSATSSLGHILAASDTSGTACIYEPAETGTGGCYLAAFLAGFVGSIDFAETNGRATAAFKSQTGITPSVSTASAAANLIANGYNFYGAYATRSQGFEFFYPGSVSGPFQWIDSYVDEIQFTAALQQALMNILTQIKSIAYTAAGYGLIRAALLDPILAAVNFGTIRQGVPLSNAQAAEVNQDAGVKIDGILSTQGWYLQISPATSQIRQARTSPPMKLWYTDGGSIQQITLASVLIQ